jgi:cell division protein FtsQ
MDGGGRLLRPLTAGAPGDVSVRIASPAQPTSRLSNRFIRLLARPRVRPGRSVTVPLERRIPRFLGSGLALAFLGAVVVTGLGLGGHLQAAREHYGDLHHILARALGLGVDRVTISGIAQLTEPEILRAAGISPRTSLPFLSVRETRERLEQVPLIKSASVRKLYPNELAITLVEREAHALWQKNGELFIIAADGTVIDSFEGARFAYLPLVVGEQANLRTKDYLALLEAAGPLKSRIRAGTLVSGRRWTLKIDNGIDVRLPEHGSTAALARLIELEREQNVLQKDVIAIDLRMADRIVVRLTEEAASARLETFKKKPMRGKGVET